MPFSPLVTLSLRKNAESHFLYAVIVMRKKYYLEAQQPQTGFSLLSANQFINGRRTAIAKGKHGLEDSFPLRKIEISLT